MIEFKVVGKSMTKATTKKPATTLKKTPKQNEKKEEEVFVELDKELNEVNETKK